MGLDRANVVFFAQQAWPPGEGLQLGWRRALGAWRGVNFTIERNIRSPRFAVVATNDHPGDDQNALVLGLIGKSERAHADQPTAWLVDGIIDLRQRHQVPPCLRCISKAIGSAKTQREGGAKTHEAVAATLHGEWVVRVDPVRQ